jgi:hypothetical protein
MALRRSRRPGDHGAMNARYRTYAAYSAGEIQPHAMCGAAGRAVQEALRG